MSWAWGPDAVRQYVAVAVTVGCLRGCWGVGCIGWPRVVAACVVYWPAAAPPALRWQKRTPVGGSLVKALLRGGLTSVPLLRSALR